MSGRPTTARSCQTHSCHYGERTIFQTLAHFATLSLTGEQLFPVVWEGVRIVESMGLKVICITADGGSPNRKFFKMHQPTATSQSTVTTRSQSKRKCTSKITSQHTAAGQSTAAEKSTTSSQSTATSQSSVLYKTVRTKL